MSSPRRRSAAASRTVSSTTRATGRAALLMVGLVACGDGRSAAPDAGGAPPAAPAAAAPASDARADSTLERSARDLVAFLRAERPLDARALADTVELRVAPEGGGAVRRVGRDALRDRTAWTVAGRTGRISLVPPAGYATLATRVGRHLACQEQALATRAPDLAARPHVGARLQPEGATSCLQSWNATFVFDTAGGSPRLSAVLYDQWEW